MNGGTSAIHGSHRETEQDLACEIVYRFLGAALSDPHQRSTALLFDRSSRRLVRHAADLLRSDFSGQPIPLAIGESPAEELDLAAVLNQLPADLQDWNEQFEHVFGVSNCRGCPLYETEYHPNEDAFFRAQQMADVAGFYRAFGLEPGSPARERPDHLGLELEFSAFLLLKRRNALCGQPPDDTAAEVCQAARLSFLRDHLAWWVPSFSLGLRAHAGGSFYESVARVLSALIPIERQRLDIPVPRLPLRVLSEAVPAECAGCPG